MHHYKTFFPYVVSENLHVARFFHTSLPFSVLICYGHQATKPEYS